MILNRKKNIIKLVLLIFFGLLSNCQPLSTQNTPNASNSPKPSNSPNAVNIIKSPEPVSTPVSGGQNNSVNSAVLSLPTDFLKASDVDFNSATLNWQSISGAKFYRIYQDGKIKADNLTVISYKIDNLSPQTDYVFEIVAVNEAGESNKSRVKIRTYIPGSSGGGGTGNNAPAGANPPTSGSVDIEGGYN